MVFKSYQNQIVKEDLFLLVNSNFISAMEIKDSIFPKEKEEEFPWDDKALQAFKKVIREQGIKCRMDDIFLLGILRATKYDMQRSLKMLKNYYEVRIGYPQYFKDLLPSKLEHVLSLNCMQILPKPDSKGRFIYFNQIRKFDTSVTNGIDGTRCFLLTFDLMLNFHRTQENSVVIITDASGMALSHFLEMSPSFIYSLVNIFVKDTYPLRYKEIHYVNVSIMIKAILTMAFPLLPTKLKERLHLHSDMSTLHEFIHPDFLPLELGDNLPSDSSKFNNMIRANEEFFRKNEEYLRLYEEERNKHFSQGKFTYIGEDFEDEKVKKFLEKSEEKFKCYSDDPEAFMASLKQDSELEITHF
ncbi:alpha-tocopherol transfer protein-like isoform X2 [Centruroides sculpturatus]|uniref:alpha-tocopherol transfer protein-like isoform X2 n=1 Tax=Centruroides sculpturatus TaxID=218467 RepID=UPI000C6CD790|nr:alpha-tocopherol transfer protein-like isoform X2 [Centruroides sculpturatus]